MPTVCRCPVCGKRLFDVDWGESFSVTIKCPPKGRSISGCGRLIRFVRKGGADTVVAIDVMSGTTLPRK